MSKPLYQLHQEIAALHQAAYDADDPTYERLQAEFEGKKIELADKMTAIGHVIADWESQAEAVKREEARLAARRKTLENRVERLLAYTGRLLGQGNDFQTPVFSFKWRRSEQVKCEEPERLPALYQRTKIEADKRMIGDDIRAGATIPGAELVEVWALKVK